MQIGMVGLGRMGGNMSLRLLRGGHEVVGYAPDPSDVERVVDAGGRGESSLGDLVTALQAPRTIWLMVPAGTATQQTLSELEHLLDAGDLVVDGGNSKYTDSVERAETFAAKDILFADVGVSGGIWGLDEGFCLMVGTTPEAFMRLEPVLTTLAPEDGYAHVGPNGAGHFVKMVHNGIEYGLMQSYGEGFELLQGSEFELDLAQVAEVWRRGSVVRSWLLDLTARALGADPHLDEVAGFVEDSGEGRWTLEAAIDRAVPMPAIAMSLFARFASRQDDSFSAKLLAALRKEFGGHAVHDKKP